MEVVFLGEIGQAWGRVEPPIVSIYSIEPLVHPVTLMGGIQLKRSIPAFYGLTYGH
jgi:hypothetical protein